MSPLPSPTPLVTAGGHSSDHARFSADDKTPLKLFVGDGEWNITTDIVHSNRAQDHSTKD